MLKKLLSTLSIVGIGIAIILSSAFIYNNQYNTKDIKLAARRASLQPVFHIPVMRASFTNPLPVSDQITNVKLEKILNEKKIEIEKRIREIIDEKSKSMYNSYITDIEAWGIEPVSSLFVPIGSLPGVPKYAKFLDNVIVVAEVDKENISAWEKKYEKDILVISELANISPSKAKDIITSLRSEGYIVSKEVINKASKVKLLWFRNGWSSNPQTLDWKVSLDNDNTNIITGYDSRGILEIRPVSIDRRVFVKAGYLDLKDEFKKTNEVKELEKKIEDLKEELNKVRDKYNESLIKKEDKRDISKATWGDVSMGIVKLEQFWMMSAASGVFLGNMRVRDNFSGIAGTAVHHVFREEKAVVLTNAHVARQALEGELYLTEDKEIMWVLMPGYPYIRFTKDSDHYGSPAHVLAIESDAVMSMDFDTAILVTSSVPEYEKYKAVLGNSDLVEEGTSVCMVGNPTSFQKFMTEGIISNKNYSVLDTLIANRWLSSIHDKIYYNWLKNSNMWFDTPIGIGGTSGSGVWALNGSEKGKVIALHNMGLVASTLFTQSLTEGKKVDIPFSLGSFNDTIQFVLKEYGRELFKDFSYRKAIYKLTTDDFESLYPEFKKTVSKKRGVDVSGMNGAVPINKVKQYLQERGLDPKHFNWKGLNKKYWER